MDASLDTQSRWWKRFLRRALVNRALGFLPDRVNATRSPRERMVCPAGICNRLLEFGGEISAEGMGLPIVLGCSTGTGRLESWKNRSSGESVLCPVGEPGRDPGVRFLRPAVPHPISECLSPLQPRHCQPPLSLLLACKQGASSVLFAGFSLGFR